MSVGIPLDIGLVISSQSLSTFRNAHINTKSRKSLEENVKEKSAYLGTALLKWKESHRPGCSSVCPATCSLWVLKQVTRSLSGGKLPHSQKWPFCTNVIRVTREKYETKVTVPGLE